MPEDSRPSLNRHIELGESFRVAESLSIAMRNYFSTHMLRAALDDVRWARQIEGAHSGGTRFDVTHRGHVLGAVVFSVAFLEAMVNELFQDAVDGHGLTGRGYLAPLSSDAVAEMRRWWADSEEGYDTVLKKCRALVECAGGTAPDLGSEPFQSVALLVKVRNGYISHYKSETVTPGELSQLAGQVRSRLKGAYGDNPLMKGSGNAWWPDHAMGAGLAQWAFDSVVAVADAVVDAAGIDPNYRRNKHWFDPDAGGGSAP